MKEDVMKIKYILYARKSSEQEDRQVLSIDSQTDELKSLAQKSSITITDIRTEAFSAKAPGRPIFSQMLDDVQSGKAQGIIVWNPDRLSRNSMDTGRLIYLFDLGKLQEIITPSQVFKNTPNDKFLLNLLCSQAKLENDNKGINVKRGLRAKCERGIYPAPAPTGYLNDRYAERGNKTVQPDPERFDIIRKIFNLMLTGNYTVPRLVEIATKELNLRMPTGRPIARNTLYYTFTNPLYYGSFEYPLRSGNWYKGIHKPMINMEEYDKVQELLGRKGRPRPKTHIFAFTGMMTCTGCGSAITAEEKTKHQQNGNTHHYIYYHCTKRKNPNCTERCIEEKKFKEQVAEMLDETNIPHEFHVWAMKWFRNENEKDLGSLANARTNQHAEFKRCMKKISNIIDMRAAEEINEEEFRIKKSELLKDKHRLEELMNDNGDQLEKLLAKAEKIFNFAETAKAGFATGNSEQCKRILADLGSNLQLHDRKLSITIEKPLVILKPVAKEVRAIHASLEPRKNEVTTEELEHLYTQLSAKLRGLESNQDSRFQRAFAYH